MGGGGKDAHFSAFSTILFFHIKNFPAFEASEHIYQHHGRGQLDIPSFRRFKRDGCIRLGSTFAAFSPRATFFGVFDFGHLFVSISKEGVVNLFRRTMS